MTQRIARGSFNAELCQNRSKLFDRLERVNFYIFIFLMPFQFFHPLGLNSLGVFAWWPSFFFFVIGFLVLLTEQIFRKNKLYSSFLLKDLAIIVCLCSLHSFIMAAILFSQLGNLGGQNTFGAIQNEILYNVLNIFIIYYISVMMKKTPWAKIIQVTYILTIVELIIGYLELGNSAGIGVCRSILKGFSNIGLVSSQILTSSNVGKRVILTFSEPSYCALFLFLFSFPILGSQIIEKENIKKNIILLLLFLPLIISNHSTSVLLGLLIFTLFFAAYLIKQAKNQALSFFHYNNNYCLCICICCLFQ